MLCLPCGMEGSVVRPCVATRAGSVKSATKLRALNSTPMLSKAPSPNKNL